MEKINEQALLWMQNKESIDKIDEFYCSSRDIFQARLEKMKTVLLQKKLFQDDVTYLLTAITGEIGNNSFDHNIGNWPKEPGVFFGYDVRDERIDICISDKGVGILHTLKSVMPDLKTHKESLVVAFTKRISGRAPEKRGNGLKFVKGTITQLNSHMIFRSGNAIARLNKDLVIEEDEFINGCYVSLTFDF
jgi:anti-sigma regulatory factor (Ser/Thr protein kinase)